MRLFPVLCVALSCSPPPMMVPDAGGSCGTAKVPPNLMEDSSFECKDGMGWTVVSGDFAVVDGGRTGSKAARLTATATGAGQFGVGPVVASTSGNAYCVTAWVKGTATDMRIEVLPTMAGVATTFSSPVTADWVKVPLSSNLRVQVAAGDSLYLRLRIQNGQGGQTLLVDDVDFWESDAGTCTER